MSIRRMCRQLVSVGVGLSLLAIGGVGLPPVVDAAKKGDWAAVRALIEQGDDVNSPGLDGTTALHWASVRDDLAAVELLLHAGADPNAMNDLGATPLWAASLNGSASVVATLLAAGADANAALRHGETALVSAVRSGNADVVELLLESGADPDARGPRDQTALMWAVANRLPEIVRVLVEHDADVHARSTTWTQLKAHEPAPHPENHIWVAQGGNTPLMFAARVGDLSSARLLVAAGANVNDTDAWGISAVTMAAYSNFGSVVSDPTFSSGGPFHLGGHEVLRPGEFAELVEFLLEQGADPNLGGEKFTALHAAIMRRDDGVVEVLLRFGADPNLRLGTFTPIQRGSNTSFYFHRAWVGATPVWLAGRFGTPRILRMVIEHGGDPLVLHEGIHYSGSGVLGGGIFAARREEVTTPLMAAVGMSTTGRAWVYERSASREHEAEILAKAQILLDAGVDVDVTDHEGRTALEHAEVMEYTSVVDLLSAVTDAYREP